METICSTGIRVSEVRYITVEAARMGKAEITLKGKIRVILLPAKLCRKLLKYAKTEKTAAGAIFRTGSGREIRKAAKCPAFCGLIFNAQKIKNSLYFCTKGVIIFQSLCKPETARNNPGGEMLIL